MKSKIIKIAEVVLIAIVTGLVLWLIATAIPKGIEKQEVVDCLKLERYSREYADTVIVENGEIVSLFYITEWQSEMCKRQGIEIDARIKR